MTDGKLFICSDEGRNYVRVIIAPKPDLGLFAWLTFVGVAGIYNLAKGNTGGWLFIAFGLMIYFAIILFFFFSINSLKRWLKRNILANSD